QALGNVDRRAAPVLAFAVTHLVQLGQGAFGITGGHAYQCHHPHPENSAGTTEVKGNRHASQVTGTNAGGKAGAQGLKRRDAMNIALPGAPDGPNHLAEVNELEKAQANSEEHTDSQQAVYEDIAPENRIEKIDNCSHGVTPCDLWMKVNEVAGKSSTVKLQADCGNP